MKTILLALLLTTTTVQADTDFTRVLQVEDYPCNYILTKAGHLTFLEATADCRKEVLAKKYRPYYKDKLYNCTDRDKRDNTCKVVPVSEPTPVLLILLGLFFIGYGRFKRSCTL